MGTGTERSDHKRQRRGISLPLYKEVIWKQQLNINFMSNAKAKDSVEGRNAFYAVFLYAEIQIAHSQEKSSLLQYRQGG